MTMAKIVCIGSTSKDIFFPTKEGKIFETPEDLTSQRKIAFELGAKFHTGKRYEALGGCAANVCCGLKKLGIDSSCYTTIGDDLIGKWILNEFEKQGVDTGLVISEKECPSDLSAIVVDKKSGERIIFSNQVANTKLKIEAEKIGIPDWIFIGDLNGNWETNLDKILTMIESARIGMAFNPRQKTIHDNPQKVVEAIKKSRVVLLNKDESIEIVSSLEVSLTKSELNDEINLIKKLKDLGPDYVALTDGRRGAWVFDGRDVIYADATGTEPRDTTGAGDAYSSGFLAAIIKGKSLEEALKWGIINSGNSVGFYGAHEGLLNTEQITDRISDIVVSRVPL